MKILINICAILFIFLHAQILSAEEKLLFGADIKRVAQNYLAERNIFKEVLISDKRAYFPCAEDVYIEQKNPNSWNTIKASCGKPATWSISFRTKEYARNTEQTNSEKTPQPVKIVFTKRNIPKGKVLQQDDFVMKWASSRASHGAYLATDNLVGHKAKRNMARDTIIKVRHILANNAVNKNDTVLIISGTNSLSIVTYGEALTDGKVGDMVVVRNSSSLKEFKAIVTAEKKVSPITNIN